MLVNADGQLGTVMSSMRFKEGIHDMGEASRRLMALRPVTFRYRAEAGGDGQMTEFGLIAEEVAEVLPELAVYDADGTHLLAPMLLNEIQTQQCDIETQAAVIAAQREQIAALAAWLERMEPRLDGEGR